MPSLITILTLTILITATVGIRACQSGSAMDITAGMEAVGMVAMDTTVVAASTAVVVVSMAAAAASTVVVGASMVAVADIVDICGLV